MDTSEQQALSGVVLPPVEDPDEWLASLPQLGWWTRYAPNQATPTCFGAYWLWPSPFLTADVVVIREETRAWFYRALLTHADADPFDLGFLLYSSGIEPPAAIIREALAVAPPGMPGAPDKPDRATDAERLFVDRLCRKPYVIIPPQRRLLVRT